MNETDKKVLNKAISNLIKNREFLGFQLTFLKDALTFKDYSDICDEYSAVDEEITIEQIKKEILVLFDSTERVFDVDEISVMLNCEINDVETALNEILGVHNE